MKPNDGTADRIMRIAIGPGLIAASVLVKAEELMALAWGGWLRAVTRASAIACRHWSSWERPGRNWTERSALRCTWAVTLR